ncbi:hypothetical protein AALO_G00065760 [Alosa alosa]|uniref:Secreted protein n=1 Tax=Alosa alosa TaxID=278164 RepID=A0AAV6H4L6_9TELE|nr:hypothetical protein AALO_G00065760 [Alosa alosa]
MCVTLLSLPLHFQTQTLTLTLTQSLTTYRRSTHSRGRYGAPDRLCDHVHGLQHHDCCKCCCGGVSISMFLHQERGRLQ